MALTKRNTCSSGTVLLSPMAATMVFQDFLECSLRGLLLLALLGQQVLQANPPVRTHSAKRNSALLQQVDQMWPRDIEHVGGFLRRHRGMDGGMVTALPWTNSVSRSRSKTSA